MSIFSTWLSIESTDDERRELADSGIDFDVIGDSSETDALGSPWVYQGSHILPAESDERGGAVDVAAIPNHITRDGRDDGSEGLHDWLRLDVIEKGYGSRKDDGGKGTVILNRPQVEALRNTLSQWLEAGERF